MGLIVDCCECGRHVVIVSAEVAPEPRFCMACLHYPSWYKIPELRERICPSHDGRDPADEGIEEQR